MTYCATVTIYFVTDLTAFLQSSIFHVHKPVFSDLHTLEVISTKAQLSDKKKPALVWIEKDAFRNLAGLV